MCILSFILIHQTWSKCHHQMSECNKNYMCSGWFLGVSSFSLSLNLNLPNFALFELHFWSHEEEEVTQENYEKDGWISSSSSVCCVRSDVKWFRVWSNICLFKWHKWHVKRIKLKSLFIDASFLYLMQNIN